MTAGPLGRLRGLPAGQDRRAGRRRRRAAAALPREGVEMRTLVPGYPAVHGDARRAPKRCTPIRRCSAGRRGCWPATAAGLDLFVLDAPHLFDRAGNPYLGPDGRDWPDNAVRFAALARVGADLGQGRRRRLRRRRRPCPRLAGRRWRRPICTTTAAPRPATVMTIHNLAFQGHSYGLPARRARPAAERHRHRRRRILRRHRLPEGAACGSPTGSPRSRRPTRARSCTPEVGMALDGLLRSRAADVEGILNGIDDEVWNPATDAALAADLQRARSRPAAPPTRPRCRRASASRRTPTAPLFGVVSRLTSQKGLDLLLACLPGAGRARRPAGGARRRRAVSGGGLPRCAAAYPEPGRLRHRL